MLTLALVALATTLVLGTAATPDPTKCCIDKVFSYVAYSSHVFVVSGTPLMAEITVEDHYSYDFNRRRQMDYVNTTLPDGTLKQKWILQDFMTQINYTREEHGKCKASRMSAEVQLNPLCLPAIAVYRGEASFGRGPQSVRVNKWEIPDYLNASVFLFTTLDHCVPVSMHTKRHSGAEVSSALYMDYRPELRHPTDLDIPDDCPTPADTDISVGRR